MTDIREISFGKTSGEDYYDVWTSDQAEARKLERKGWHIDWDAKMGLYVKCRLPKEAVTIRTKRAVESAKTRGVAKKGVVPPGLAR